MSTIASLEEARSYLKLASSVANPRIQLILDGVEDWLIRKLDITVGFDTIEEELCDGGETLLYLTKKPVIEITEVRDENGDEIMVLGETWKFTDRGPRKKRQAYVDRIFGRWPPGDGRWIVSYTAGYSADGGTDGGIAIPVGLKLLVLDLFYRAWNNPGVFRQDLSSSSIVSGYMWDNIVDSDLQERIDMYSYARSV